MEGRFLTLLEDEKQTPQLGQRIASMLSHLPAGGDDPRARVPAPLVLLLDMQHFQSCAVFFFFFFNNACLSCGMRRTAESDPGDGD